MARAKNELGENRAGNVMIHNYFSSLSEWMSMGHYAEYVWSAYAIVITALIIKHRISVRQNKRILKMLRRKNEAHS